MFSIIPYHRSDEHPHASRSLGRIAQPPVRRLALCLRRPRRGRRLRRRLGLRAVRLPPPEELRPAHGGDLSEEQSRGRWRWRLY